MLLLGDQLIRESGIAVFELVKNAYDADASKCTVTMTSATDPKKGKIAVQDNGTGMDPATVTGVWLEPGTDYRARQRKAEERTKKYGRLPLGEKGVGRFAAHKLGQVVQLVTRAKGQREVVVRIDWSDFEKPRYLSAVPVSVRTRPPKVFKGRKTGTRIEVSALRESWSRGAVRRLYRSITSICSPFDKPDDFVAELVLEPKNDWLDGLLATETVLAESLFRATGTISASELAYDYRFVPLPGMKGQIDGRKRLGVGAQLARLQPKKGEPLDLSDWDIGEIQFEFHIFDREPLVLNLSTSDKAGLKRFLDQNGGVRVYRDGVRVYDFGEPGNDWLDLGGRRVNIPTVRISNNQIIGAVSLQGDSSADLVEKTNREGFIESKAYDAFRQAVLFAITQVEAERKSDKERLRKQYSRTKTKRPVLDDLSDLRNELEKRNLVEDLGGIVNRIEQQFLESQETLLAAAGSGLMLTTVVHEVEKVIKELVAGIKRGAGKKRIRDLVHHLAEMVDGLTFLARKSGSSTEKASTLIAQAFFNTEYRLRAHSIRKVSGIEKGSPDFSVKCVRRLVVATLMNFIDNSIYWLENKRAADRRIYIGTSLDLEGGPAIIAADNGPGYIDPPETLVEPFFTRKPDGMGLGLHIANEIAKMHQGQLLFPERSDVRLPRAFTGAVTAIQFPEAR